MALRNNKFPGEDYAGLGTTLENRSSAHTWFSQDADLSGSDPIGGKTLDKEAGRDSVLVERVAKIL